MKMRQPVTTSLGLLLVALGLLGPLTFADDLRHFGEMAAAIGFVLSGSFLLAPRLFKHWRCGSSFPLASPFILFGLAAGTFMDKTMTGVFVGACVGSAAAWWHCSRHRRVAA